MKKILVPCDFSKPAINAYRFALNIASRSRGAIHLIYVVELPVLHDTMLMPVLSVEQDYVDDVKMKAEKNFKKLVEKHKRAGVKVKTQVVFGPVSQRIIDYVKTKNMDLIIMGSHGASGVKEFFVGSNAEKIVRTSSVPVFVLKDLYDGKIERIVFSYTFETDDQKNFVGKVSDLQKFFKAHIDLVWINTPGVFYRDLDTLKRMGAFVKRYRFRNYTIHVFNDLNEREGIINFTETVRADLIVMGTHGRKGLINLLSGSITENVVNHVRWPIWTSVVDNSFTSLM
jgi:nucleotide-binding universal stress UspA family protein